MSNRNHIAAALRRARKGLSPAQRATRGAQRRYHIWGDASTILACWGFFVLADEALDRAVEGWHRVDPATASELERD